MQVQLPIFPLNTVVFPGVTVPLHVFEERYRALVHHLLTISEKPERLFGIVAIREGYEVGSHGVQSVHRVGCVVQMTSVDPYPDGRFDIEVVGRRRLRLDALDTSGSYLVGDVETVDEARIDTPEGVHEALRTRETFEEYRRRLSHLRGDDVLDGDLPRDPEFLSYSLAATCLLTLQERQALLEASGPLDRLIMLRHALREEMRAMRAIPSLPATEVARTSWSPN
ncbi:MAG TPA: LON peptidase substrate-binding domain-containing protein [Nocardioides sp.]|uniref:LON peptidase substrate-binding domain-containing protein n=1 Tax=Nocardioides sp. TaxID=35761 RepID=UPI002D7E7590|nr:LON peptidase substrate-binding domain-containing protein [Nocardioides sp.]HET6653615.1 LON peptidase substrate-binding domain-containing protein [Nocardioides sp.]